MGGTSYRDAGVDIEAGARAVGLMKAAVEATHGPEVLAGVGAFGGLFDAKALQGMTAPVLVGSTDGVGTKTKIATSLGRFDTIGHDIVNHCIDDILVQGARPLFFLDYVASSRLDPTVVAAVVTGAAQACKAAGCALLGGETAEMPGVYETGELDLVGTIVGVVDRADIVTGESIVPGDLVVAIPSAGLHTNGFSLARRVLADQDLRAPNEELGTTLGEALLAPHRCYLPELERVWAAGVRVKGMAHITGGGLRDNPPRTLPDGATLVLHRDQWTVPPLFRLIQRLGGIADDEMAHVFNLGLGMLLFVAPEDIDRTCAAIGDEALRVGEVVPRDGGPAVRIS